MPAARENYSCASDLKIVILRRTTIFFFNYHIRKTIRFPIFFFKKIRFKDNYQSNLWFGTNRNKYIISWCINKIYCLFVIIYRFFILLLHFKAFFLYTKLESFQNIYLFWTRCSHSLKYATEVEICTFKICNFNVLSFLWILSSLFFFFDILMDIEYTWTVDIRTGEKLMSF